ncbi:MAG: archease [Thermodesulfovibrionales bacterium]|nr:archease [Thermodesulfovibrionales bacterium]
MSNKGSYEPMDISGDAGIRAVGKDLKEVFINAALGMYSLITDIALVEEKKEMSVTVTSSSSDGLLVAWLNELIFQFDTYGFTGKGISINELNGNRVNATVRGEDFDPGRHEKGLLIKAATYHNLKIEKKDGLWSAEIVFDI